MHKATVQLTLEGKLALEDELHELEAVRRPRTMAQVIEAQADSHSYTTRWHSTHCLMGSNVSQLTDEGREAPEKGTSYGYPDPRLRPRRPCSVAHEEGRRRV